MTLFLSFQDSAFKLLFDRQPFDNKEFSVDMTGLLFERHCSLDEPMCIDLHKPPILIIQQKRKSV